MKREDLITKFGMVGLLVFSVWYCSGCASQPVCIPEIQIQEVLVETQCAIRIEPVVCAEEIAFPPFDPADPKAWALEVQEIDTQNKVNAKACEEALRLQIAEHNRSEIMCN